MLEALIFAAVFVGLSVALTVIAADLLSPQTAKPKNAAQKLDTKRASAAS